jgi:hypothetical protein
MLVIISLSNQASTQVGTWIDQVLITLIKERPSTDSRFNCPCSQLIISCKTLPLLLTISSSSLACLLNIKERTLNLKATSTPSLTRISHRVSLFLSLIISNTPLILLITSFYLSFSSSNTPRGANQSSMFLLKRPNSNKDRFFRVAMSLEILLLWINYLVLTTNSRTSNAIVSLKRLNRRKTRKDSNISHLKRRIMRRQQPPPSHPKKSLIRMPSQR